MTPLVSVHARLWIGWLPPSRWWLFFARLTSLYSQQWTSNTASVTISNTTVCDGLVAIFHTSTKPHARKTLQSAASRATSVHYKHLMSHTYAASIACSECTLQASHVTHVPRIHIPLLCPLNWGNHPPRTQITTRGTLIVPRGTLIRMIRSGESKRYTLTPTPNPNTTCSHHMLSGMSSSADVAI